MNRKIFRQIFQSEQLFFQHTLLAYLAQNARIGNTNCKGGFKLARLSQPIHLSGGICAHCSNRAKVIAVHAPIVCPITKRNRHSSFHPCRIDSFGAILQTKDSRKLCCNQGLAHCRICLSPLGNFAPPLHLVPDCGLVEVFSNFHRRRCHLQICGEDECRASILFGNILQRLIQIRSHCGILAIDSLGSKQSETDHQDTTERGNKILAHKNIKSSRLLFARCSLHSSLHRFPQILYAFRLKEN